ncbi:MAG TPA: DedA family protein [Syntrophomonas sp.]|nr:DedA family protein [Syntrophomonas sp.]HRW13500.1 DedA family protein [Syntrophomonas sp.]
MEYNLFISLLDLIIHLDKHLIYLINTYGVLVYAIIFLIIFCETGLVVTPFLPGDSLIFVLGALGASGQINLPAICVILMTAAILGNMTNYQIGRFIGPKIFERDSGLFFKKEYLIRTHAFFEKHGGKTIVIARFMPIIRTFAPFVAGIGEMDYARFTFFNLIGCVAWVAIFLIGGYLFGNVPGVQNNFTLVIFAIIFVSLIPAIVVSWRQKRASTGKEQ